MVVTEGRGALSALSPSVAPNQSYQSSLIRFNPIWLGGVGVRRVRGGRDDREPMIAQSKCSDGVLPPPRAPRHLLRVMHFVCNMITAWGKKKKKKETLKRHPDSVCGFRKRILTHTSWSSACRFRHNENSIFHQLVKLAELTAQVNLVPFRRSKASINSSGLNVWAHEQNGHHFLTALTLVQKAALSNRGYLYQWWPLTHVLEDSIQVPPSDKIKCDLLFIPVLS